jgi:hypothetical protein
VFYDTIDVYVAKEAGELFKRTKRVLSVEDEREIARQFMDMKMANIDKLPM